MLWELTRGIQDYWAFVLAVVVFLAVPGPGNVALITSTTQGGLRAGMAAGAGVMAGDQVLMWLAVAGVAAILSAHARLFAAVQYAGAAYLAYLGVKMIMARGGAPILTMEPHHYFRQGMLITLLNPKAIVFYMAFFPLFVNPAEHRGVLTFAVMALTIATVTLLYCLAVIALTHVAAQRMRTSPRITSWLNKAAGTMLLAFGVKLAVGK